MLTVSSLRHLRYGWRAAYVPCVAVSVPCRTDEPLIDPLLNDVTPEASNIMGLLYFGTMFGATGHLEVISKGDVMGNSETFRFRGGGEGSKAPLPVLL